MIIQNVIILNDYASLVGGATKVAIQSAIGLAERGYNVIFFSAVGPIDRELNEKVKVICLNQSDLIGGKHKIKSALQGIWNKKAFCVFSELLAELSVNNTIIHIHSWTKALSSSVFKAACKKKFKIIVTLHDYFVTCPNGGFYNYKKDTICYVKPLSFRCICCDCDRRNYINKVYRVVRQIVQNRCVKNNSQIEYIYISEKNKLVAQKWMTKSNNWLRVTNPIELYNVLDAKSVAIQNDYFIYIGRIVPEKGVELFCNAVSTLNFRGIVIGDGEQKEALRLRYPNIEFVGWKTHQEMKEYLQNARALVFPSKWYEGAPLTIIEALSCGIPCIVSDCTSASEIIIDNKNGYIFQSDNTEDLCEKILLMTSEKSREMRTNILMNLESFKSLYSITAHIDRLIEVYSEQVI